MSTLFHASKTEGIGILEPRVSNHGIPLVYFSEKRENVLPYLSNAVEKYCHETDFDFDGIFSKWGSYGFDSDGILRIEEYYPNALEDTYSGVKAYIYTAEKIESMSMLSDVPFALTSSIPIKITNCEVIYDAYIAILEAEENGLIRISRYKDLSIKKLSWIRKTMVEEYKNASLHPEYKHFIKGKFGEII